MSELENNLNGLETQPTPESIPEQAVPEAEPITYEPTPEITPEPIPQPAPEPTPIYTQPAPAYTNEYTYNPEPSTKKESKGGKVALGVIASVLGAFIVVVLTLSVYTAVLRNNGVDLSAMTNSGDQEQLPDWSDGRPDYSPDGVGRQDEDNNDAAQSTQGSEADEPSQPVVNRDFPTLEQLAAPEDAMSIPDIYEKVSPSVVGISSASKTNIATGTGIIMSTDGYIVTNAHVINGAQAVSVLLHDGTDHEAEIIGYDTQSDLAVLKIDPTDLDLIACEFGISNDLRTGELVVAIGNPLGFDLYGSITSGIISGQSRAVTIEDREMVLLQTSAAINAGNSGGPLIDAYGRVIGINSAKISETAGEGIGFAIPIDDALPVINDLMQYGYVPSRPMLGISGEDINAIMSMFYKLPQGVYVREITPGSGAEKAGIQIDDIIIGADGETVTSMDDLNKYKRRHSAGETMTITVYRNGEAIDLQVVLDMATQAG